MDNLEKFVRDFLDDKVEPYLKSEPVPDNTDAPVKVRERIMLQLLHWTFYYLLREVEMWKLTLDIFSSVRLLLPKTLMKLWMILKGTFSLSFMPHGVDIVSS